ncbi:tetratricopeptide repeat protein 19, mitochondrial [Bombina bombina]|uniref:tetratricopeptide repeat protein 19, mitochondrial n=1 Tax=Bombina bombina TaxID=8345 RepID=UPI00235B030F|nr:tetratricopeptide repeat protein 19, mitochondrial [Bombina bombina]XP_053560557.1 tetratricopeptide repeat protein 19, mitochondrial [Bombina bombina]XP_053560559.1 tetratricopeptide repeat protein 19, mitochondrial [Bombina bombina]
MALHRVCGLSILSGVMKMTGSLQSIQAASKIRIQTCALRSQSIRLSFFKPGARSYLAASRLVRSQNQRNSPIPLLAVAAFSFFSKLVDNEQEENTESEEQIIYLLKKAKLSMMKDEMEEAEVILHQALHMAQQGDSRRAILYTNDLMANLALLRGQLDKSEKLFKATMRYMLEDGVKQDDNAFIEISLKLASIYAAQKRDGIAVAGYQFCIMSLEEKIEKERDLPDDILTAEDKSNTRLLLGLCLDSYGRYLLDNSHLSLAQNMYEKALKICREEQGELHPHTLTLMNDLATVLDAQGHHDKAFAIVNQASELAHKTEHPDHHVLLSNMAAILMYQGPEHLANAEQIFKEALKKAKEKKDAASVEYIQKRLSELEQRKEGR